MQAILAAPIDRLPVTEKQLVQTLAVIGKRFQLKLAAEVAGKSQQELIPALDKLQEREFIYEQPSQGDVESNLNMLLPRMSPTTQCSSNSARRSTSARLQPSNHSTVLPTWTTISAS